jgi:arylsulfatase A-like enzyme
VDGDVSGPQRHHALLPGAADRGSPARRALQRGGLSHGRDLAQWLGGEQLRIPLQGTDADVTESAIEFMLGSTSERFFLYLHYMDVHQYLYADTSPDWGSGFSDIYDSSIHWTDRNVGVLVDALKSEGLLDKTMIVISSDHGEAFFEHGAEGHAKDLYREVQHVPWIVVPPFALEQGIVVSERVANVDIWPTLLDLLGLPEITGAEGKSLVPLVLATGRGEAPPSDLANRAVFSQLDRSWGREADPDPIISVVRDPYRMIQAELDPEQRELFDSSGDPLEKKNIAARESTVADELSKVIEEFLVLENEQWGEAPEIELDEMKKAQLRALGYVVGGPPRPSKKKKQPAPEAVEAAPGS